MQIQIKKLLTHFWKRIRDVEQVFKVFLYPYSCLLCQISLADHCGPAAHLDLDGREGTGIMMTSCRRILHYWPFMRGINGSLMVSLHKGSNNAKNTLALVTSLDP